MSDKYTSNHQGAALLCDTNTVAREVDPPETAATLLTSVIDDKIYSVATWLVSALMEYMSVYRKNNIFLLTHNFSFKAQFCEVLAN